MAEHELLTLEDYWMDRQSAYRAYWTREVQVNGAETVRRINLLVPYWVRDGVDVVRKGAYGAWSSGWRPPSVNAATANAAPTSKHMLALAGDVFDPDGEIDDWCFANQHILTEFDLYMEHPSATKGWCHLQIVPPKSQAKFPPEARRRWFYP